jgi:hypothetical protein
MMSAILAVSAVIGVVIGALVNTLFRGGKISLVTRVFSSTLGAVPAGFLAYTFGLDIAGPIIGAMVAASIGAVAGLTGISYYEQT